MIIDEDEKDKPVSDDEIESILDRIGEDWTLKKIVSDMIPPGWGDVFSDLDAEFTLLNGILVNKEKTKGRWYPFKRNVFRLFWYIRPEQVKVVIFAMDPYYTTDNDGLPTAQGIAFMSRKGAKVPHSLNRMYTELAQEYGDKFEKPYHGDLRYWVKQGVFLINASLTVQPNEAGSHKKIWQPMLGKVIRRINKNPVMPIYMLWGNNAKEMKNFISSQATVLESNHPAAFGGFLGNGHFMKANEYLVKNNLKPIDWNLR